LHHTRTTGSVGIDIIYNADIKKFSISQISIHQDSIIQKLKEDSRLYSFYFK
jgi:hypothetical protein